jgi:hypothetical protein
MNKKIIFSALAAFVLGGIFGVMVEKSLPMKEPVTNIYGDTHADEPYGERTSRDASSR